MSEEIIIPPDAGKEERYRVLLPQIEALLSGEPDAVANLANITAALKSTFDFLWIGFYLVRLQGDLKELVLGPFQGPVACTRIGFGKGVCGTAWKESKTLIVPDVDLFPGHITCSSQSRSEIVVPVMKNNQVIAVIDADSERLNDFDNIDALYLEKISQLVAAFL